MNKDSISVSIYINELILALCAIITGVAQLRAVRLNWKASHEVQDGT